MSNIFSGFQQPLLTRAARYLTKGIMGNASLIANGHVPSWRGYHAEVKIMLVDIFIVIRLLAKRKKSIKKRKLYLCSIVIFIYLFLNEREKQEIFVYISDLNKRPTKRTFVRHSIQTNVFFCLLNGKAISIKYYNQIRRSLVFEKKKKKKHEKKIKARKRKTVSFLLFLTYLISDLVFFSGHDPLTTEMRDRFTDETT